MGNANYYDSSFLELRELQCWDIARHLPYNLGTAFAYVWRAGNKTYEEMTKKQSMLKDLKKAKDHLDDQYNHFLHSDECTAAKMAMSMLCHVKNADIVKRSKYAILSDIANNRIGDAISKIEYLSSRVESWKSR